MPNIYCRIGNREYLTKFYPRSVLFIDRENTRRSALVEKTILVEELMQLPFFNTSQDGDEIYTLASRHFTK